MSRELRVICSCENGVIISRERGRVVGAMICKLCKGFGMRYPTPDEARNDNW